MEIKLSFALRMQLKKTGRSYVSNSGRITVGREPLCDLSFPDSRAISRRHAQIFYREGSWYVVDTNSINGTWVNGKRLTPNEEWKLSVGDEIDLAHDQILVFLEGNTPAGATSTDTLPLRPDPIARLCNRCASPVSGRFCPTCGCDIYAAGPATPPPPVAVRKFCPYCGSPASGRLCDVCGGVVAAPRSPQNPFTPSTPQPSMAPPPPAPSMAPSPAPAPQPRMAPSAPPAPSMAPPAPAPSMAPRPAPAPAARKAPAKKQGLLSKMGSLFGGKSTPAAPQKPTAPVKPVAPTAPAAPVTPDDVQFRGAAPKTINPGEFFTVKIMMYREDDYQRADRETAGIADEVKSASSSVFQAQRGQKFRISLQSPDIELDGETQQLSWNGKFAAADFEAFLPEDYDRKQVRIRGRVYSGDAVLTDLKLILQVSAPQAQAIPCEKVRLRSAFISYASADRAKVVARIQGIQLACPDMDLFFDVESLRRGESWENRLYQEIEQRDLFYLFWSQNAASSDWVQKELQYAVSQKTVDFIEPIPLEEPAVCPPPSSLMGKHFNDWTLRYLNNQ